MAWTGTVLSCTTLSEQAFTLTFYADGAMWTADDPQGLLEVTAGDYRGGFTALEQAETTCFYEERPQVAVLGTVAALPRDATGAGSIAGSEGFQWVCTAVFD